MWEKSGIVGKTYETQGVHAAKSALVKQLGRKNKWHSDLLDEAFTAKVVPDLDAALNAGCPKILHH